MNDSLKEILEIAEKVVRKNEPEYLSDLTNTNQIIESKWCQTVEKSIIKCPYRKNILKRKNMTDLLNGNNLFDRDWFLGKSSLNHKNIIKEAFDAHNECREKHGAEPLSYNLEIAIIAQQYANNMARSGKIAHSNNKFKNEDLGENIYSFDFRDPSMSGKKITLEWYNEIIQHKFMGAQYGTGHFTQLIWKSTKEVGFGIAFASSGRAYFVANYFPTGNIIGKFAENVKHIFN